jgi:Na+:H+ antiporter, NhaA family
MDSIKKPFDSFLKLEIAGSIILLGATILALIFANSPLQGFYTHFWEQRLTIGVGEFIIDKDLIHWINDGLMAIFFFVIGLEIKREILVGELNNLKKASLPIFGAIGGMVVPVMLFFAIHQNKAGFEGWGIPMATDIAFTLGILKLLGNRVPLGLKVFLTAFAIVDDIGAVLVIALFYSSNIHWAMLFAGIGLITLLAILGYFKFYSKYFYFIVSVIVWILFLKSGVHATIAGILLAFTIPVSRTVYTDKFLSKANKAIDEIKKNEDDIPNFLTPEQQHALVELGYYSEKTISPLQRLEHTLHGWVIYFIMPIFAFANAGVILGGPIIPLTWSIGISMVLGKAIGIWLAAYMAVKFKLAQLPANVNFNQLLGIAFLGGLGFTMALFITDLAYKDMILVNGAKTGILIGSLIAGIVGYVLIKANLSKKPLVE